MAPRCRPRRARLRQRAGGRPIAGRIAVWYLPREGAQRSYLARAGEILRRASLFRPDSVGPWLYVLILLVVLPALALASVRCLALAAAPLRGAPFGAAGGVAVRDRRDQLRLLGADHAAVPGPRRGRPLRLHAVAGRTRRGAIAEPAHRRCRAGRARRTSRLKTRASSPTTRSATAARRGCPPRRATTRRRRQSSTRAAPTAAATRRPRRTGRSTTPRSRPPTWRASSSPFSQLTLMRLTSALIGALTVLFTFLLARELAPGRPWLAVLAALLVAFEPMYGFISGAVNNDVGVNAGAAALELLLIRMLRRGVTLPLGHAHRRAADPAADRQGHRLFAVPGRRNRLRSWRCGAITAARMLPAGAGWPSARSSVHRALGASVRRLRGLAGQHARHGLGGERDQQRPCNIPSAIWATCGRSSCRACRSWPPLREHRSHPAFVIFVERGWGAFGWYDVLLLPLGLRGDPRRDARRSRCWPWSRRGASGPSCAATSLEAAILLLMPIAVVAGFEAAFYTTGTRPLVAEFGRYAFPAIAPLAVLVVASLHAFPSPLGAVRGRWTARGHARAQLRRAAAHADRVLCLTMRSFDHA